MSGEHGPDFEKLTWDKIEIDAKDTWELPDEYTLKRATIEVVAGDVCYLIIETYGTNGEKGKVARFPISRLDVDFLANDREEAQKLWDEHVIEV